MKVIPNIDGLVGRTPLVALARYQKKYAPKAKGRLLAKLEYLNPTGSSKDRAALAMIEAAEKSGALRPGGVIIEPTSGNTGIGLAAIGVPRGYRVILTMPDTMSVERRRLLAAYGAELVLTEGALGMSGAIAEAERLHRELTGSVIAGQFDNPANPDAHYRTTAREIWEDCEGEIDLFVCGVGTGGTFTGVGRFLKEKRPEIALYAVEPKSSPLLSEGISGPHGLQGIGANFIPKNYESSLCDGVIAVTEEEAYLAARRLSASEGYLCGISSGAALAAATALLERPENEGKTVVVLLPDSGSRYLSTPLFE